jgi:hypothetical protein
LVHLPTGEGMGPSPNREGPMLDIDIIIWQL